MKSYIYIETYGCSANKNNSEILKGILTQLGCKITNNEKIAEMIILNTCIVKQKTENKIKRRIQDISKQFPNKLLIITGCMPETDAKQIKQLNEKTILLGTHHFKDIINLIKNYNKNQLTISKQNQYLNYQEETKLNLPKIPNNKLISITQISEGCLGNCSFCKVRLAKGKLFSYPEKQILKSIENDLKQGAKEIWITSQDCANYGMDKNQLELNSKISLSSQNKSNENSSLKSSMNKRYQNKNINQKLPQLLNKILNLNHRFKLRLGMSDPNNIYPILEELIKIYKNPKVYKFLHIPIQSASNKILKDMNRLYKIEQAEKIIKKFRQEIPNITIATDIIVGYPTETKSDHIKNMNFIKKFKPDVFNLSKFSSHKQTPAGKLKQLSPEIIHKRAKELMQAHRETAEQNKQKFLNKEIKVFVNKKLSENLYEARDNNYNVVLINSKNKSLLGKNTTTKIKNIGVHHIRADLI